MKRYRVVPKTFDLTANLLISLEESLRINPSDDIVEKINQLKESYGMRYGILYIENKLDNIRSIGVNPFSIVSYHNSLIQQIRDSFITGNYYPALTGACALGERILNHLILDLRTHYQPLGNDESIFTDKTFSNWRDMILKLDEWNVLLPEVSKSFKELKNIRNKALHFSQSLPSKLREVALEALILIQNIIANQFSAFGLQPWFIPNVAGESYLKREWETIPFIKEYYLKINSYYVGPSHKVKSIQPWQFEDDVYSEEEITDEKFVELRKNWVTNGI